MTPTERALKYSRAQRREFTASLQEFVRIPSVSSDPRHRADIDAAARWLAQRLRNAGLQQVELACAGGHPIVYAEQDGPPGSPTVLVYGHYDVQPATPLEEWRVPPFAAEIVGPDMYGRGTTDDKGQLLCHVNAIEAWLKRSHES